MALSNLPAIRAGIAAQFATATGIENVALHPPSGPSNAGLIYFRRHYRLRRIANASQEQAIEYTLEAVAALPMNNNLQVGSDMDALVIQVLNVSGHDLSAHGEIIDGQLLIESGEVDEGTLRDIPVLFCIFQVKVIERVPYDYLLGV